jgi:hypothetical protein
MDTITQARYADMMQRLINQVRRDLDADVAQYAYDNHISEDKTYDFIEDEFIHSGDNAGSLGTGYSGTNLTNFLQWVYNEAYNSNNNEVRDLAAMDDDQWQAWLKEERETREQTGDINKAMLGIMFGGLKNA